jgi:hypothetical protein
MFSSWFVDADRNRMELDRQAFTGVAGSIRLIICPAVA